jgi:hypothetical protein
LNFAAGSKLPPLRTFQEIQFTGPNFGSEPAPVPHKLLIDVPTKIWRPKQVNAWREQNYRNDIDEDILVFKDYGAGLSRTKFGKDLPPRDDVEFWDDKYQAELDAGLKIGIGCPPHIKERVIELVKKYWDNFYAKGSSLPIRGF